MPTVGMTVVMTIAVMRVVVVRLMGGTCKRWIVQAEEGKKTKKERSREIN
jgi:Na+-transporting methylmalonyl-CoA/oxaloacetate decarboxylase gamma subunit